MRGLTRDLTKVREIAMVLASDYGGTVGTEHLLAGIASLEDCYASQI